MPPEQYLKDCELTYLTGSNPANGDGARLAKAREFDMRLCNADKRALRAWYQGAKDACGWRCRLRSEP